MKEGKTDDLLKTRDELHYTKRHTEEERAGERGETMSSRTVEHLSVHTSHSPETHFHSRHFTANHTQSNTTASHCDTQFHPLWYTVRNLTHTHTHLFKPHAEISPPRPHLWTQEETDYWDRLLISPQMIPLHLFFSHFSFLFLWFSLLQKTSKKKNKKKMPANEKHHWGDVTEISVTAFFRIAFKVHSQKLTALLWTRSA